MMLSPTSSLSYFLVDLAATLTLFGNYCSSKFDIRNVFESPLFYWLEISITSFCVASLSFSFLKCLIYSDQEKLAYCLGVYLLPVWNIVSTAYFYRLWSIDFDSYLEKKMKAEKEENEEKLDAEFTMSNMEQIAILCRYSANNLPWLFVGLIVSLISSSVNVALPHYISLIMNGITTLRDGVDITHTIKVLAGLTIARMLLTGLSSGLSSFLQATTLSKMRKDLFNSVIRQEIAFFDHYTSGKIVARITSDVDRLSYRISDMFTDSINEWLTLVGKLLFMISISWQLTVMNFVAFPIIIYVTKLHGDFSRRLGEEESDASAESQSIAKELISTIRTVRSFGAEKRSTKKFFEAIDKESALSSKQAVWSIGYDICYDLYYNFIYLVVLMYGAYLVNSERMVELPDEIMKNFPEDPHFFIKMALYEPVCRHLTSKIVNYTEKEWSKEKIREAISEKQLELTNKWRSSTEENLHPETLHDIWKKEQQGKRELKNPEKMRQGKEEL